MNRLDGAVNAMKWIMVFMLVAVVTGCNNSDPIIGGNIASSSSAKAITEFSLAGNSGIINEPTNTIAVMVNNFSSPLAYIVTLEDTTAATYTVTVAVAPGQGLRRTARFAVLAGTSITNELV